MNNKIPNKLFYTTILFRDGSVETPHYLVFDDNVKGVETIKQYYKKEKRSFNTIFFKEIEFLESRIISEDTHILLPTTDYGLSEDQRDPIEQQLMVEKAEEDGSENSIMAIFPEEQENDELFCRAFYMGPFRKANNVDRFISSLKREPFETSVPLDNLWFYQPTGEVQNISF